MSIYSGEFHDDAKWYQVWKDEKPFDPKPSLQHVNHSPDGFAFGFGGSGPAQLAFAMLLEEVGSQTAHEFYMAYKDEVIAMLRRDTAWTITSAEVRQWVRSRT